MFFGQKPLIAEDVQDRLGDEERLSLNPSFPKGYVSLSCCKPPDQV